LIEEQLINSTGVSSLPQLVRAEILAGRFYRRHLDDLRALAARQAPRLRELVLAAFPEGTRISDPAGGFLFWIECPGLDALAFALAAKQAGIAIAPGPIFSATPRFNHCLRLSAGLRLTPQVEAAIGKLGMMARDFVGSNLAE
jgi:DNA-binding transcriptional MocR family regulator